MDMFNRLLVRLGLLVVISYFNGFLFQAEKGSRFLNNALFTFCSPVPVDASAREELLVRALYKVMQEEH